MIKLDVKLHHKLIVFFILCLLLQVFVLTFLHPLYLDDWYYSFMDFGSSERVTSLLDIVKSQYNHYFVWGGRTVAHLLAQFFILAPKWVHAVANSFVYVGYVYLIYRFANLNKPSNVVVVVVAAMLAWFGHNHFPETVIYLTGSCNYLWCTFIILLFFYSYYKLFFQEDYKVKDNLFRSVAFFVAGIVAGWTNENMCLILVLSIVLLFIYAFKTKKSLPSWFYSGAIGCMIGATFLLLAPGNTERLLIMYPEKVGLVDRIVSQFTTMSELYLSLVLPFVVIFVLLFVVSYRRQKNRRELKLATCFFVASHLSFFVMIGSPTMPIRATFGTMTLMIIGIAILYANLSFGKKWYRILNYIAIGLIFTYYLYSYNLIYFYTRYMHDFMASRESYIEQCKQNGVFDVELEEEFIGHKKFGTYELDEDPTIGHNPTYARLFGLKSVRINRDKQNKTEHIDDERK